MAKHPFLLCIVFCQRTPISEKNGATIVCNQKSFACRWVRADGSERVSKLNGICCGCWSLRCFRENIHIVVIRSPRWREGPTGIEIPDHEYFIIADGGYVSATFIIPLPTTENHVVDIAMVSSESTGEEEYFRLAFVRSGEKMKRKVGAGCRKSVKG